ncbi:SWIM zinc finger family protein [Natronorubrum daqingense]|uniref:SWIM zinc finger n=1 Tax=Natronorubrum daqingense TaxID=588898 RepID=A0A1N7EP09_9EURY|nr:SWIM zinc finger family protein [Natronorubrum daqingense]APX97827.1 hypothetical protein BB347_15045 [Natronorubrum daqingense]SIR89837.1 SWIM zinc finger [Natronorubrum daqingense]
MNTTASPKTPLPVPSREHLDGRSRRARSEAMSVRSLGRGLYEVESASDHTYLVDLESARCTCPDHIFREARCKHIRRVAIEITDGRTPPPGELAVECHDCGKTFFVPEDDDAVNGPAYCSRHTVWPGETVVDRETGDRLTVVDVSDLRADAVEIGAVDTSVAEYATNERYEPDVPVVGAIYPHATVATNGVIPDSLKVYVFPRTRLEKAD